MEVLHTKHPDARPLSTAILDTYPDQPPELIPVDTTKDTLMEVAGKLSRGEGPGGTDLVSLQQWILRFGLVSAELRLTVEEFAEWLGNGRLPLDYYRALLSGRLIALDKEPGGRPVGVGENCQRLMAKFFLSVMGQEAKSACGTEELDGGGEVSIDGGIQAMRFLWAQNYHEENWEFTLVDYQNAFNQEKQMTMFWAVRNEWPAASSLHLTATVTRPL